MSFETHYRPAMPFGNRKKYFRESSDIFKRSSVLSKFKRYHPPWKPEIQLFRHFPKLQIAIFNGKNAFNFS